MIERYSRPEMVRIWSETARFERIFQVEMAVLRAQARRRRLPVREVDGFEKAARGFSVARVQERERVLAHDVEAFLEEVLSRGRRFPRVARLFHFGMTSSDVLDTALALQMVEAVRLLEAGWDAVLGQTSRLARAHRETWMAGRSHGIHGEPITFGFKVAGWHSEALRHRSRLAAAREQEVCFGKLSGAMGNFSALDPALEAEVMGRLGLKPEPAATQVVPRDRHAVLLARMAISAGGVERVATEIRHLQRTEVGEAFEPFGSGQKGSSAMPHKRNPVLCENLCGLARLVRGFALAGFENVALWHERDISHSSAERVALPDACILLDFMLHRLARVLGGLEVDAGSMRANLEATKGAVFSQRVLLALLDCGLDRNAAYRVVQRCAFQARGKGEHLRDALARDPEARKHLGPALLDACFDLAPFGRHVPEILRRAGIK